MTIQDMRDKLEIIETAKEHPERILTELFCLSDSSEYIQDIVIQGKTASAYLTECMGKIPAFHGTSLWMHNDRSLFVTIPRINEKVNDVVIKIDMRNKTYQLDLKNIHIYEKIMSDEPKLRTYNGPYHYERYKNFTVKNRIKRAFSLLFLKHDTISKYTIFVNLKSFLFVLTVSREKIDKYVEKEEKRIKEEKESSLKWYQEELERHEFYLENAPKQIEKIKETQRRIAEYLQSVGYKEER